MRNLLFIVILVLVFDLLLFQCANPKAPTGGPKDTIPPTLVRTIPPQGTILFTGTEITLEFDERIADDKLQTNLIITPQFDAKYKTIVKKNSLILRFEEPFPDSTTMTLNFFDGITDITENNPVVNLSYVFSTGSYLDSLTLSGKVLDLMTYKENEGYIVGLYPDSDTIDFFTTKPYYFTSTLESGSFTINNIKNGHYRLLTFNDANRNLTFDPTLEAHGFMSQTIRLDSNINNLQIRTLKQNVSELKLISRRTNGRYYDVRYSKGLDSINIEPPVPNSYLSESNSIRFYKPPGFDYSDSLQTIITSFDSLKSKSIDTLFIKFQESTRKPASFKAALSPEKDQIQPSQDFSLNFTKPVNLIDTSLLFFRIDSLMKIPVDSTLSFNLNRTQLIWKQQFDTAAINSFLRSQRIIATDTLPSDTLSSPSNGPKEKRRAPQDKSINNSVVLISEKGAFLSIENDTLEAIDKSYSFPKSDITGTLIINITTEEPSYFIEIINKKYETIEIFPASPKLTLNLPASEYGVRILIDDNQDGKWSNGNLLKNLEPERVVIYPDFTSLRANWDVNIDIQF